MKRTIRLVCLAVAGSAVVAFLARPRWHRLPTTEPEALRTVEETAVHLLAFGDLVSPEEVERRLQRVFGAVQARDKNL